MTDSNDNNDKQFTLADLDRWLTTKTTEVLDFNHQIVQVLHRKSNDMRDLAAALHLQSNAAADMADVFGQMAAEVAATSAEFLDIVDVWENDTSEDDMDEEE